MSADKMLGETAYDFRLNTDAMIMDTPVKKGAVVSVQNQRLTKFWDIYLENGKQIEVTEHYLWKKFLVPEDITFCDEVNEFEMFKLELDMNKFFIKPNMDLSSVFTETFTKEEYLAYEAKLQNIHDANRVSAGFEPSPYNPNSIPIERQALWISWPMGRYKDDGTGGDDSSWGKDLGKFKDLYAVILKPEVINKLGMLLTEHTFYLEVTETDDRYRFFLKYNHIIGSRWMFENYKGETWHRKL